LPYDFFLVAVFLEAADLLLLVDFLVADAFLELVFLLAVLFEAVLFFAADFFARAFLVVVAVFFEAAFFGAVFFVVAFLVGPDDDFLLAVFLLLVRFFVADFLVALLFFLSGTFLPSSLASESPIAIACLGLVTFFPERPLFSFPSFISCITFPTFSEVSFEYLLAMMVVNFSGVNEKCVLTMDKNQAKTNGNTAVKNYLACSLL